jgi:hypothetical protein
LSEIDTNAALLPIWENYKPDCVFRPDVKKEPLKLWRDWQSGIEEIHRNKKMLKIWKKDWTPNQKKTLSRVKVVIDAIREGSNAEGVHVIIKSLTFLQGKYSICTLNESIN